MTADHSARRTIFLPVFNIPPRHLAHTASGLSQNGLLGIPPPVGHPPVGCWGARAPSQRHRPANGGGPTSGNRPALSPALTHPTHSAPRTTRPCADQRNHSPAGPAGIAGAGAVGKAYQAIRSAVEGDDPGVTATAALPSSASVT